MLDKYIGDIIIMVNNWCKWFRFLSGRSCKDHLGKSFLDGELFSPLPDPCVTCLCKDGRGKYMTVYHTYM